MNRVWMMPVLKGLIILAAVWCGLRWFEWKNLFHPTREMDADPATYNLAGDEVRFTAEDGVKLFGWWLPASNAIGTIIHFHGNGENISHTLWRAADLHKLGLNVLLADYRGYGRSGGWPTEQGTYRDARAAFEVARERSAGLPMIAYGVSLGGAVAIQLALDRPLAGLIVESSFASVPAMAQLLFPYLPVQLVYFQYDSIRKVPAIKIPKLFAHSTQDDLLPFQQGRQLFTAAAEPKEFVALKGGHNNSGWTVSPAYWAALSNFVHRVTTASAPLP